MLNCKIANGIAAECDTTVSGVLRLAFLNFDEKYKDLFYPSSGNCPTDSVALTAGEDKIYEVNFLDGSGLAEVELNVGDSADQKNFTHRITMNIAKLDCNMIEQYKNWSLAHVIAIAEMKNRDVYVFGLDSGLAATTFNYSSGSAATDSSGINAVFEGISGDAPVLLANWDVIRNYIVANE